MAPPHNQSNLQLQLPLPLPSPLSTVYPRCSTSQMCLFKILHIISSFPSTDDVTDNKHLTHDNNKNHKINKVDIDLNVSCKIDESDTELAVEDERATEHSVISHVEDQSSEIEVENKYKPRDHDEGYLGLLIEAAQLILGEPDNKPARRETEPSENKRITVKRKQQQCWTAAAEAEWHAEFEDTSPVVKSKRGRNQVLPYRYRDSVVERWSPATHRSISVPSKPRSK